MGKVQIYMLRMAASVVALFIAAASCTSLASTPGQLTVWNNTPNFINNISYEGTNFGGDIYTDNNGKVYYNGLTNGDQATGLVTPANTYVYFTMLGTNYKTPNTVTCPPNAGQWCIITYTTNGTNIVFNYQLSN